MKRIRWGGRRLGSVLGKPIGAESDYAESWEIADHGDDQSVVVDGPFESWTLSRLVTEEGAALFGKHQGATQFSLLVKYLDATDRLSVQVHPNDEQARQIDVTENGKTEAWVFIDAGPDSKLYAGLKKGVDSRTLSSGLANETVEEGLHSFSVSAGDCLFIPAGTVHAIGEGILLAEIQQSSDLTFRLYDWGRTGTDGKPRELHIEQSLACIDFDRGPVGPVTPRIIESGEHAVQELVRNPFFVIHRHRTDQPFRIAADDRFHVLMMLDGNAEMICGNSRRNLSRGRTVLMPASSDDIDFIPDGTVTVLESFLP